MTSGCRSGDCHLMALEARQRRLLSEIAQLSQCRTVPEHLKTRKAAAPCRQVQADGSITWAKRNGAGGRDRYQHLRRKVKKSKAHLTSVKSAGTSVDKRRAKAAAALPSVAVSIAEQGGGSEDDLDGGIADLDARLSSLLTSLTTLSETNLRKEEDETTGGATLTQSSDSGAKSPVVSGWSLFTDNNRPFRKRWRPPQILQFCGDSRRIR